VATAAPARVRAITDRPVVIEVRGVRKTFHVPRNRVDTLKERVTRRGGRGG